MNQPGQTSQPYDPEHPWYRDERDDPSRANWLMEFFNPDGLTTKPVFLRGQVYLWLARLALIALAFLIVPTVSGGEHSRPILAGVFFGGFAICALASTISHLRRLQDSGRPGWSAIIVPLPLILASILGLMASMGPPPGARGGDKTDGPPAATQSADASNEIETAEEGTGSDGTTPEETETATASDSEATENRREGRQRGGRNGRNGRGGDGEQSNPPLPPFVLAGFNIWLLFGFVMVFYTMIYAARREPKS